MSDHKNIYCALAAAQAAFSAPKKDAVNPAFRSKYADLSSVVQAVTPALTKHGIALYHHVVVWGDMDAMRTVLHHGASDTSIACDIPLIVAKRDMQGFKSATTYAKRIGLESVTGVAPDDDDGNDAAKAAPPPHPTRQTVPNERMETEDGVVSSPRASPASTEDTPAQRAAKAAEGIVREIGEVKTERGVEGVWTRNEGVIKRLRDSYPEEFARVVEVYETRMRESGVTM